MRGYGIAESMKDFYWDIRPKPEYGTIEIRACDTPLTVAHAAALAAYAQVLARHFLSEPRRAVSPDHYLPYNFNRFQACRHGLEASIIDPLDGGRTLLAQDIVESFARLEPHATALGCRPALEALLLGARARENDARRMRARLRETGSLAGVVRWQCERWMQAAV
jgi:carboxylate-amine ligase